MDDYDRIISIGVDVKLNPNGDHEVDLDTAPHKLPIIPVTYYLKGANPGYAIVALSARAETIETIRMLIKLPNLVELTLAPYRIAARMQPATVQSVQATIDIAADYLRQLYPGKTVTHVLGPYAYPALGLPLPKGLGPQAGEQSN